MRIDRALQKRLLEHLRDVYPQPSYLVHEEGNREGSVKNMFYLAELGLIRLDKGQFLDGTIEIHGATITAKGIDFLEDDGGVGAILGTLTVKLHEDTLRQLIESKLRAASIPEEQKNGILKALREAPAETTKQLITKLVDLGMENAPKAVPLIQTLLQGGHS